MNQTESIYNLIKTEYEPIEKRKHYISKYPPNIPPTSSTFGNLTTSKPNVSNINGSFEEFVGPHKQKGQKSIKLTKILLEPKKGI
jgi:hypothetical protein